MEKGNKSTAMKLDLDHRPLPQEEQLSKSAELNIAYHNLLIQHAEKEKLAAELIKANIQLIFSNKEKENCAAELTKANKELAAQNREKEQQAAALIVANNALVFQHEQHLQHEAELVNANKLLVEQNKGREELAAQLQIANKELVLQNTEKEKRAAELRVANKELAFQNKERGKRAAELVIAKYEAQRAMELEAANKELESFTYSVSHDLRAPLRAINGFTRVLVEDFQHLLDDDAKSVLAEIIGNSNKMGELIDNLLEFSRLGKQPISVVNVNINDVVDAILIELKKEQPARIINIKLDNLENRVGDRSMLKQVFVNLLANAFKYTSKKEQAFIEIGCYAENNSVTYFVKDNGAGFDMLYYDKLFGVFQRLHSSNEFEGTGVGLAIIHKIVTKHGGRVWAEGKVNEGACFYVSLPDSQT